MRNQVREARDTSSNKGIFAVKFCEILCGSGKFNIERRFTISVALDIPLLGAFSLAQVACNYTTSKMLKSRDRCLVTVGKSLGFVEPRNMSREINLPPSRSPVHSDKVCKPGQ